MTVQVATKAPPIVQFQVLEQPASQLPTLAAAHPEADALRDTLSKQPASFGARLKRWLPTCLGGGVAVAVASAAAIGAAPDTAMIASIMGAAAAGAATLFATFQETLGTPAKAITEAKAAAAKLVAEELQQRYDAKLTPLVKSVTHTSNEYYSRVVVDLDPVRMSGLTESERAAVPGKLIALLPESVQKLAPSIEIVFGTGMEARALRKPGVILPTIGATTMAMLSPVAGFLGGIFGAIPGAVVGGAGWLVTAVVGGAVTALLGSAGAYNAAMDIAFEVFRYGLILGSGAGAVTAAVGAPWVLTSQSVTEYRKDVATFRQKASELLVPAIESCRAKLPSAWRNAIGAVSVGRDERGYAVIAIETGPEGKAPGDEAALKKAIADVLPKELQAAYADVPLYFARGPITQAKPTILDRFVSSGIAFGKGWEEAFDGRPSKPKVSVQTE